MDKKRNLIALFVFFILNIFSIEIIEETQDYLKLRFELPDYKITNFSENGEEFQKIEISDCALYSEEGKAQIPYFAESIGLPINGDISISVLSVNQESIKDINLSRNKKMILSEENDEPQYVDFKDNSFSFSDEVYPAQIVSKGSKAFIGDRYFTGILINPFQYIPKENKLIINKSIDFIINISGDKSITRSWSQSNNFIDKFGGDFFLNNETSKMWRKEKVRDRNYHINRSQIVTELQLIVDKEGIYKVTYEYLADSLQFYEDSLNVVSVFDWERLDPRNLELCDENGPVPIYFYGERDGSFDEGDYFEFYGEPHLGETSYYDDYTQENVYTLKLKNSVGARFAIESGGLSISGLNPPRMFKQTKRFEQQNFHLKFGYLQGDFREDLWMWRSIIAPNQDTVPFELEYPYVNTVDKYSVRVCLMGSTHSDAPELDHHAMVMINSAYIDNQYWDGQSEAIFKNDNLPNSSLLNGENNLYVILPGDTPAENEQVYLDYFEIDYWREYRTDKDELKFSKPEGEEFGDYEFKLNGFNSNDVSLYKLGSSKIENISINGETEEYSAPYEIRFQDNVVSENVTYYIVTEDKKKSPKLMRPNIPSNLKSPHDTQYAIITPTEFVDDEGTLLFKEVWESQGVRTEIIDLQDIFDEFNFGIRSAESIKDFISYAYNNWNLTHVLLLGDGTEDERDWSVNRKYNKIPLKYVWSYKLGATASDNWYACIVGDDGVPDISIGRINVFEKEQILPVAEKTQTYVTDKKFDELWHSHITLSSGGKSTDATDIFAQQSETIRKLWIPKEYNVSRVYTYVESFTGAYQGSTFDLKENIDNGSMIVQFMGHGGGRIWADYNLFNANDVKTLTNEVFPVFISLSCYGGAFETNGIASIGEYVVCQPEHGGIGHLGFSGLGYMHDDLYYGLSFYEGLFSKRILNIGELHRFTLAKFWSSYPTNYAPEQFGAAKIALTYGSVYTGDPMIDFWLPEEKKDLEVRNIHTDAVQHNVAPADTVLISVKFGNDIDLGQVMIMDKDEITLNRFYNLPVINGELNYQFKVPNTSSDIEKYIIKAYGFNSEKEVLANGEMTVGTVAVANMEFIPAYPTALDSVMILGNFFDKDGVDSVQCVLTLDLEQTNRSTSINMIYDDEVGKYKLTSKIPPQRTDSWIYFNFRIVDSLGNEMITDRYNYHISGPELAITDMEIFEEESNPKIRALMNNSGSTSAENINVRLYRLTMQDTVEISTKLDSLRVDNISQMENKWIEFNIPILNGNERLKIIANEDQSISEKNYSNNFQIIDYNFNYFYGNTNAFDIQSSEGYLELHIPENSLLNESIFEVVESDFKEPINQEDIAPVPVYSDSQGVYYKSFEIKSLNSNALVDGNYFANNNKALLSISYEDLDSLVSNNAEKVGFALWEDTYKKWIWKGGEIDFVNNKVVLEISKIGEYAIVLNNDEVSPIIEVNVEEQEFTNGGYIANNGIFSFQFSDANGIDIFENKIKIYIDDNLISEEDYSLSIQYGHLTHVPIKYQVNLDPGTHYLVAECTDVNGKVGIIDGVSFRVSKKFDVLKFANYPNPVKGKALKPINDGRTRFMYLLADDADEVTIKVYTVSGRLVKTFKDLPTSVGYHEYPKTTYGWDCKDDEGIYLANGVYFYKIIAKKGHKKIEKVEKMAILK